MTTMPPKRRVARGTTTVEFALMLPLLISLGLASVDLGRFAYVQISLNNAVRAGADIAATTPWSAENNQAWRVRVTDAAKNEWAGSTTIDANHLELAIGSVSEGNGLARHTLEATYPFQLLLPWPGIPNPLVLRQVLVTRRYR